jgi:hypothetical protein
MFAGCVNAKKVKPSGSELSRPDIAFDNINRQPPVWKSHRSKQIMKTSGNGGSRL